MPVDVRISDWLSWLAYQRRKPFCPTHSRQAEIQNKASERKQSNLERALCLVILCFDSEYYLLILFSSLIAVNEHEELEIVIWNSKMMGDPDFIGEVRTKALRWFNWLLILFFSST